MKQAHYDVVIVGAGAAGLMCATEAGKRGRKVLVLEHNGSIGEKIRISGGGRCNFTNLLVDSSRYISENPHFCKSALTRYTSSDFISLVRKHGIAYHEKTLGQLFCNGSSERIIDLLLKECRQVGVEIRTKCGVARIQKGEGFFLDTDLVDVGARSLVIASGGLSIPKLGATNFGYRVAEQFGLSIVQPKPGLVPLKFGADDLKTFRDLSGVSVRAAVRHQEIEFMENMLFTHRGLSGPAILQVSSYWDEGESIFINLLPDIDLDSLFQASRNSRIKVATILERHLPKRFVQNWMTLFAESKPMNQYSSKELGVLSRSLTKWEIIPVGTEGFGKAEVTVGGIDTTELSSKTMEAKKVPGLFFIGEVVDVTGWLGGYNFQWAWSSGWVAGQYA
jgi:predicted Rossmann fold flavoprotein